MPLNIKSNEIFLEKYILVETFIAEAGFAAVSCETYSENFINFPEEHFQ